MDDNTATVLMVVSVLAFIAYMITLALTLRDILAGHCGMCASACPDGYCACYCHNIPLMY